MKQINKSGVSASDPAPIGHNSDAAGSPITPADRQNIKYLPPERITIWTALDGSVDEMMAGDLAAELAVLKMDGQRLPVIVRPAANGTFEAVVRAGLVALVREHNKLNPDDTREVRVTVAQMADDEAFRHAANEIAPACEASSYARGCFFHAALDRYRTAEDVAHVCAVSKAAVSKNLDVFRAVTVLGSKIEVRRDVSQRAAMWLMTILGRAGDGSDAPDQEQRRTVLEAIDKVAPGSATKIFAALKASIKTKKPGRGETPLKHKGLRIGTLRQAPHGGVRIDLPDAGDITPDDIAKIIREALAISRNAALI